MKSFIELSLFLALLFVVTSTAKAAERFSVQDWKASFAKALDKNETASVQLLTNFKVLEDKAIPKCVDCESQLNMKQARDLFAKGQFTAAELIYKKVPKGTDAWLESVEERGWTHFRRDDFEKTLAQTKTLLSPQFVGAVNSEAFFLQSLAQLKICDYDGILKTHKLFKENQKTRINLIQNLSHNGVNESLKSVLAKSDKFPLKYEELGETLKQLPLLFYRDLEFQRQLLRLKISQAGLSVLALRTNSVLKTEFNMMKKESAERLQARVKTLAERENKENAKIVQKLNLVEVEAIQRIHSDMKLGQENYKDGEFKKTTDDQLVFMDDGRPWIDELDKYDVAAKSCNKDIRRKM